MSTPLQPAAITSFRSWRNEQFTAIQQNHDAIAARLLDLIPASLFKWMAEAGESTVNGLLKNGFASGKYKRIGFDPQTYGYTDLNEFATRFDALQIAWQGVVKIDISWEGDFRFEVIFTAI